MSAELCALSIAGLTVAVGVNSAAVLDALRSRYQDFPACGRPQLTAYVHWTPQARCQAEPAPAVVFDVNRLRFVTAGFAGAIELDNATAELSLTSTRPVDDIEYFLRVVYAWLMFHHGGILLHAAAVVRGGRAYLFLGPSGSGKTTVARLSKDASVLNDDLVVLCRQAEGWQVYATPFWNPDQVRPSPGKAPLAAFYRLVQDKRVFAEPMRTAQALAELLANVPLVASAPACNPALIERSLSLLQMTPAYRLHFLPDDSFWKVIEA